SHCPQLSRIRTQFLHIPSSSCLSTSPCGFPLVSAPSFWTVLRESCVLSAADSRSDPFSNPIRAGLQPACPHIFLTSCENSGLGKQRRQQWTCGLIVVYLYIDDNSKTSHCG